MSTHFILWTQQYANSMDSYISMLGKISGMEFQSYALKFHAKYFIHMLKDFHLIKSWSFKIS